MYRSSASSSSSRSSEACGVVQAIVRRRPAGGSDPLRPARELQLHVPVETEAVASGPNSSVCASVRRQRPEAWRAERGQPPVRARLRPAPRSEGAAARSRRAVSRAPATASSIAAWPGGNQVTASEAEAAPMPSATALTPTEPASPSRPSTTIRVGRGRCIVLRGRIPSPHLADGPIEAAPAPALRARRAASGPEPRPRRRQLQPRRLRSSGDPADPARPAEDRLGHEARSSRITRRVGRSVPSARTITGIDVPAAS